MLLYLRATITTTRRSTIQQQQQRALLPTTIRAFTVGIPKHSQQHRYRIIPTTRTTTTRRVISSSLTTTTTKALRRHYEYYQQLLHDSTNMIGNRIAATTVVTASTTTTTTVEQGTTTIRRRSTVFVSSRIATAIIKVATAAASIAAASLVIEMVVRTMYSPQKKKNDDDDCIIVDDESKEPVFALLRSNIAYCDSGVPMFQLPAASQTSSSISSLRRHQTIQQMDRTATKVRNINDTYNVDWDHPIGQGNFGSVHVGTNKITKEMVAIKKISKVYTDNTSFQREMDALLHIQQSGGGHPNICSLREHYCYDTTNINTNTDGTSTSDSDQQQYYYLVFDYISGNEMFDQLCTYGPYSEADTARLIQEITSALAYIHGIHIVHGDLKPENIMLSTKHPSDAIIKLVDFGCAQVCDMNTKKNHHPNYNVARTIAYCPPEVITSVKKNDGKPIHPSFDMWSLGVILYIMLTGVHPFDIHGTSTDEEIEQQILSKTLPPIRNSSYTEHLSDDAISLMEQLLQWDPAKRLSANEVLQNSWVLGETARTDKITNSDTRLSKYKAFKSKLEAKVFADMISITTSNIGSNGNNTKTSDTDATDDNRTTTLLEYAFHHLDRGNKGYVTTKDLQKIIPTNGIKTNSTTNLDDEELSLSGFTGLMGETLKNRYYPAGHVIYHEGEKGDAMFFLNSGAIEIYNTEGFHKVVKTPGDFFGEGALISNDGLRTASIRCITPVHVIEVGREYVNKFVNADYDLKLLLREMYIKRQGEKANAMLQVQQCLKDIVVHKNEYIYTNDNPNGDLYLLDEGHVDILLNDHKVFSVRNHGDIFGEHSVVYNNHIGRQSRNNNNIMAQCKSDICKLHLLRPYDFDTIVNAHPSMKDSLRNLFHRREFQKAVCIITGKSFPENVKDLRTAFNMIDTNHSGKLEYNNIRNAILTLDPTYTEKDIRDILISLDLDESGEVSWPEFQRIFGIIE